MNPLELAQDIEEYIIKIRRRLHENPDISMHEFETIERVVDELKEMNIEYEVVPNGGIIGVIEGNKQGKKIALRADLDALPMRESAENLLKKKEVVSKNPNAAHTCGHDGHVAMLLGAAKILNENRHMLHGTVLLVFEQGEETGEGIYHILKRLLSYKPDGIWGIHLKSDLESGKLSVESGPRMSASSLFNVKIKGKGGHSSRPDLSNSPLDVFNDIYLQLQLLQTRTLNPFQPISFSVGRVVAGKAMNIIPDDLEFGGTIRYLNIEQGTQMINEFKKIIESVCENNKCSFEFINEPHPIELMVNNNEFCSNIAAESIRKSIGASTLKKHEPWMASEPFAFYQKYIPGVYAFLGIKNDSIGSGAEHHNKYFDIDEQVLKVGVASTVQYVLDFLETDNFNFTPESRSVDELFADYKFQIYKKDENK